MKRSLSELQPGQRIEWQGSVRVVTAAESHTDAHGYPTAFVKFEDGTWMMKASGYQVEVEG